MKDLYLDLMRAKHTLELRQRDGALKRAVDGILERFGPAPIPEGSYGFLWRNIATARYEDLYFALRCEPGLTPLWLEYQKDAFFTRNPSKMRLIRLYLHDGVGRKGGPRLRLVRLVDRPMFLEGKSLVEVGTNQGEGLVSFHHRLRDKHDLLRTRRVIDISDWLFQVGGKASEYYKFFFLACVTRGILFESFESSGFPDLDSFKQEVVMPAWEWVYSLFGLSPLIVLHPPEDCPYTEDQMLNWYPGGLLPDTEGEQIIK